MSTPLCSPPQALYLHVPFCFSLCPFCDFFKVVERHAEEFRRFTDRVLHQLQWLAAEMDLSLVDTLFIGGGTPTAVGRELLSLLIRRLRLHCPAVVELTVETNPELLSQPLLEHLLDAGMTRLSVGIQSHNDLVLSKLGRRNRMADNLRALELIHRCGPEHFSVDLIYGCEGQSLAALREDLQFLHQWQPPHVSWYQLTVEEGTPLHRYLRQQRISLPDDDACAAMERVLSDELPKAGWKQYEVSNYCRPAMECRHNQHYWRLDSYAGLGPAAVGTLPAKDDVSTSWRMQGTRSLSAYHQADDFGLTWQAIGTRETAFEAVMMGLRTLRGLCQTAFEARFGLPLSSFFPRAFERACERGWLQQQDGFDRATRQGLSFVDTLTAWFWEDAVG